MAIPIVSNIQGLGELKQNFRWDIDFSGIKTVVANGPNKYGVTDTNLSIMCESVDLPRKDIEWVVFQLRGVEVKQAGKANMAGEITLSFVDNVDSLVENTFMSWGNMNFNTSAGSEGAGDVAGTPTTTGWGAGSAPLPGAGNNSTNVYKCDITIKRINASRKVIRTYKLIGCGCVNFDPGGQLTGGDSEVTKPTVTISYDAWYVVN